MPRKLENWIESFGELVNGSGAPSLFRKWNAIATVAMALERRVWVDVGMGPLYPNLYTILVGPPGVGKTELTSKVQGLLSPLSTGNADGIHLAPASVTAAAIIDSLKDAERKFYEPTSPLEPLRYNSLAVISNDLGTLLPAYDPDMMNRLTDLYDGHPYSERRRTRELNFQIPKPNINILAATTPAHLANSLPEGAWDQGFLSRTILVFNAERIITPLFQFKKDASLLRGEIENDIRHIFTMAGEMKFEPKAAAAINAWHVSGGQPAPDHPRLRNYNSRRTSHVLKLCVIACASSSDTMVIQHDHFMQALDWLLEAEIFMPDIFKAMVVNADAKAADECWHHAYTIYMKEDKPVAEHRLVAFLQERVPVQNVMKLLDLMERAHMLEKVLVGDVGNAYKPKPRKPGMR